MVSTRSPSNGRRIFPDWSISQAEKTVEGREPIKWAPVEGSIYTPAAILNFAERVDSKYSLFYERNNGKCSSPDEPVAHRLERGIGC